VDEEYILMAKFEESEWREAEYVQEYQDNSDHYIPERDLLLEIIASFYRRFGQISSATRVLDLGCGDGIISEKLYADDPEMQLVAVDGSADMLAAARRRLAGFPRTVYRQQTFQELIEGQETLGEFDFVVSGFAIHHLELPQKKALFEAVLAMLAPGGHFLHMDVVSSAIGSYEDWYYEIWRQWIERHELEKQLDQSFVEVPQVARERPENYYETLEAQLEGMVKAGFLEVDCHYRFGLFGIYSGRKAINNEII
jgi:tRNA (cmo5U34)-methyltransferase